MVLMPPATESRLAWSRRFVLYGIFDPLTVASVDVAVEVWVASASALVALVGATAAGVQAKHARGSAKAAQKSAEVARDALDLERTRFEAEHPRVAWRVERLAASDGYRGWSISAESQPQGWWRSSMRPT